MELSTIIYEQSENIAVVKLNRPEVLNAGNRQMWTDLRNVLEKVVKDSDVKAMIITGEGRAFCVGADLKESKTRTLEEYHEHIVGAQEISRKLYRLNIPTIAAINGYALGGGCEIAMLCDIRIAAENAKLGFPESRVASSVTSAGLQLLPLLVGIGKAKEMIFGAEYIDGKEAERIGLVNMVVPDDQLMDKAMEMAKKMSANSPVSISQMKSILNRAHESSMENISDWEVQVLMSSINTTYREKALSEFSARKK